MISTSDKKTERFFLQSGWTIEPAYTAIERVQGICSEPLVSSTAAVGAFAFVGGLLCGHSMSEASSLCFSLLMPGVFCAVVKNAVGEVYNETKMRYESPDGSRRSELYDFSNCYIENTPQRKVLEPSLDFTPIADATIKRNKKWLSVSVVGAGLLSVVNPLLAAWAVPTAFDAAVKIYQMSKVKRGEWSVHNLKKRDLTYADCC